MDFSLYEDFPLFSGDLLGGLSPQPDELPHDVATEEWQLPFSYNADGIEKVSEIKQPKTEVKITIDYNNVNLFDTKVDLLDLIKPEDDAPTLASSPPITSHQIASPVTSDNNISYLDDSEALLRVSDLLASDLQSLEYASPSQNTPQQLSPVYSTIEYNAAVLNEDDNNVNAEVDSILSGKEMDSILGGKDVDSLLSNSVVDLLGAAPILSPVSTEDIDLVLRSEPTSPYSSSIASEVDTSMENSLVDDIEPDLVTVDSSYLREELLKAPAPEVTAVHPKASSSRSLRPQRQRVRYDPYTPPDSPETVEKSVVGVKSKSRYESMRTTDPKSRKKQQNKDAALRYRMKKKSEKSNIMDECSELEKKNEELKDKVDSMTREIKYLKDLLLEVHQAKTGFKSQSHLIRSK